MGGEGTPKNEHCGVDINSTQSVTQKQRPKMAPIGGEVTPNPPKGGVWGPLIVPGVPNHMVMMYGG